MPAETYPTVVDVETFAAATPDVPADRVDWAGCGEEFIGDARDYECPLCGHSGGAA